MPVDFVINTSFGRNTFINLAKQKVHVHMFFSLLEKNKKQLDISLRDHVCMDVYTDIYMYSYIGPLYQEDCTYLQKFSLR